jgi:alpha-beta hydrolase superfamily lysophospholipase
MGALVVLTASEDCGPVRGLILHSPAVAMMYAAPPVRGFISVMRKLYARRLLFNVGLIPGDKPALTGDPQFDRIWGLSADRVYPGFTWRFLDEAMKMGARARAAAGQLREPVLVLTGDKDPIGTAGVGQRAFSALMKRIPSADKQRVRFPDGYHDLIHDRNKPRALACVASWLDAHLRATGSPAAATP